MGLLKSLFTNCAHPKGRMGRAMLKFMNLTHAPLTNWGLGLIEFQDGRSCRCRFQVDEPRGGNDSLHTRTVEGSARRCRVRADGNPSEEADVRHDSWCKVTQKSR